MQYNISVFIYLTKKEKTGFLMENSLVTGCSPIRMHKHLRLSYC